MSSTFSLRQAAVSLFLLSSAVTAHNELIAPRSRIFGRRSVEDFQSQVDDIIKALGGGPLAKALPAPPATASGTGAPAIPGPPAAVVPRM
ncbi:hypothetical protein F5Y19DRAFT_455322 [Xylariaceae sp. FL1651]|nr:hypothetical protein F5Y19DRAFT_455322 [Xylariaceae sp. FL1651]